MLRSRGIHEQVVCEYPGFYIAVSHVGNPGSHKEGDQCHREGAPLWNGAAVLVRLAQGGTNLVVNDQCLLEGLVGIENACGHASDPSKCSDQRANNLVKTLKHIYAANSDVGTCGLFELQVIGGCVAVKKGLINIFGIL